MLDEASYMTAIYVYVGAAVLGIVLFAAWLRRSLSAAWTTFIALLLAALTLTPAYPEAGVSTMAPALIVAGFQFLTGGVEAAEHALKPLAFMLGVALVLSLLLRVTFFRRRAQVD